MKTTTDEGLERLGDLAERLGGVARARRVDSLAARVAAVWPGAVGEEVAHNATPRTLRDGCLTVATSSSVWAQTLQLMETEVLRRLNLALRDGPVGRAGPGTEAPALQRLVFRPAGWDPGAAGDGPRPLGGAPPGGPPGRAAPGPPRRSSARLTAAEEEAVAEVRRSAASAELGECIARAMTAALLAARRDRTETPGHRG